MNLDALSNCDYMRYKKSIVLPWTQIESDLVRYQKDTKYLTSIMEDHGHRDQGQQVTNEYRNFGYTEHNTCIWKTTNRDPKINLDWENQVIEQLPLDHAVATLTRQDPGQILPWHYDRFFMLKRLFPNDSRPIIRFLLFLEDWKMGHVLQVGNSMLTHWTRGDVVVWRPNQYHVSANIGLTTKWTCNITGFLKDD